MATSFINERTAEYYLVPALKKVLEKEYTEVASVFPWLSREFSKISKELHRSDVFRVLVMFARRPKVAHHGDDAVYATINSELERFCEVCDEYDVPVIAGCPNATDFWGLARGDKVIWLQIRHASLNRYLNRVSQSPAKLQEKDIRRLAKRSNFFDILAFERLVRETRASQPSRMYGPLYKPVYFLMRGEQ